MQIATFFVLSTLSLFLVQARDAPPKKWTVNLDSPPAERWPKEMLVYYNATIHEALALIGQFVPAFLDPIVNEIALTALPHLGEAAEEIKSGAAFLGIPLSSAALLNIIYEVEAGCTSILYTDPSGRLIHARNLDFNLAPTLRKLVAEVEFQRGGNTVFYGTTFAGYVGLLTGMKPGAFSINLNERDIGNVLENALEALLVPGTTVSSLLIRSTLDSIDTFDGALQVLSDTPTPAGSYIALAGVDPNEAAIITRDRDGAADIWMLHSDGEWFLVQTNYDHWKPDGDGRRTTAIAGMKQCGPTGATMDCVFKVLTTPNVLNGDTTYTTLMSAGNATYITTIRNL